MTLRDRGLPFRLPGSPGTNLPAASLPIDTFLRGWQTMSEFFTMPTKAGARDAYYEAVRWRLDEAGFDRAVRWAVSEHTRKPTPNQLVEAGRAGQDSTIQPDRWAGHWMFQCEVCEYTFISELLTEEPPTVCGRCMSRHDEAEYPEAMAW